MGTVKEIFLDEESLGGGVYRHDGNESATNNAVNLSGSVDLSKVNLYGYDDGMRPSDFNRVQVYQGNTLNVGYYVSDITTDADGKITLDGENRTWKGSTVEGLYNFETALFMR